MKVARGIATPILPLFRGGGGAADAAALIGNEWSGFALDFIGNTYAVRTSVGAELLLGSGPYSADSGLGLDFITDTSAVGI